jgi:hypothetical protein
MRVPRIINQFVSMGQKDFVHFSVLDELFCWHITRAAENVKEFTVSFVKTVCLKHFGAELLADKVFEVRDATAADTMVLAFFVSVSGLHPLQDGMPFQ